MLIRHTHAALGPVHALATELMTGRAAASARSFSNRSQAPKTRSNMSGPSWPDAAERQVLAALAARATSSYVSIDRTHHLHVRPCCHSYIRSLENMTGRADPVEAYVHHF
jgi:hypothetical protein